MTQPRQAHLSLVIPRGAYYRHLWRLPLTALMLPLLWAIALAFGSVSPSDRAAAPLELLGFSIPFFLTLAVPLYYRVEQRLVVDSDGVHLFRGNRLQRSLHWNAISSIAFGPHAIRMGLIGLFRGFRLYVFAKNGEVLKIFDGYYRLAPDALPAFARSVVLAAQARSIPANEVVPGFRRK